MGATVVSVGYEKRTQDDLVALLSSHGVRKLIDVRAMPISRKKGFSKGTLSAALQSAQIAYRHVREAGNPYRHEKSNVAACLAKYRQYLNKNPEIVDRLATEISDGPVAFLCFEREHSCCHRSELLDALIRRGHQIHVLTAG